MKKNSSIRVLLIDDAPALCRQVAEILRLGGFEVETASDGSSGIEKVKTAIEENGNPFNAIICDLEMPGIKGTEVLEKVLDIDPSICFIMLTGFGSINNAADSMKKGAYYYLTKPADSKLLIDTIKKGVIEKEVEKILDKVFHCFDINEIYDAIENAIEIIFHPKEYCFAIIENNYGRLIVKKHRGFNNVVELRSDVGFIKKIMEGEKVFNPTKVTEEMQAIGGSKTKSLIGVRLCCNNYIFGIIELESHEEKHFNKFDEDNLLKISKFASIAINHIKMYEANLKMLNSIAHQIKQPIYTTRLVAESMLNSLENKSYNEIKSSFEMINNKSKLAEELLYKLLINYKDSNKEIKFSKIFEQIKELYAGYNNILWTMKKTDKAHIDCKALQIIFVLDNLISNALYAIKDTDKGNVRVAVNKEPKSKMLIITVQDNGYGIKEEYRGKIFTEIFTTKEKVSATGKDKDSGSGLGLFLSKSFVVAHGGSIYFDSATNKGTTFTLKLPYIK